MNSKFALRTTGRARWLAELSTALDEAQLLLGQLVAERIGQHDAESLRMQIVELRAQLRLLTRRTIDPCPAVKPPRLIHPDWRPGRD